jgi:hypothetical protein
MTKIRQSTVDADQQFASFRGRISNGNEVTMHQRSLNKILLLAFLLSVMVSAFSSAKPSPTQAEPSSTKNAVKKAETIPFCDLLNHPRRYNGRIVRTQAIYVGTLETEMLYDPSCLRKDTWTQYKSANIKAADQLDRYLPRPLLTGKPARAEVTVVGRFQGPSKKGFGHLNFAKLRFVVLRLEKVESVAADVPYPWQLERPE